MDIEDQVLPLKELNLLVDMVENLLKKAKYIKGLHNKKPGAFHPITKKKNPAYYLWKELKEKDYNKVQKYYIERCAFITSVTTAHKLYTDIFAAKGETPEYLIKDMEHTSQYIKDYKETLDIVHGLLVDVAVKYIPN